MVSSLSGSSRRKTIRVQEGAGNSRSSTLDHLQRGWIPVNPGILAGARLFLDHHPDNREGFFSLVSSDISLCLHVSAELARRSEFPRQGDLAQRISNVSTASLRTLLPRQGDQVSRHDLRKMSPAQAGQLQRTLVAQKTAQAVAERTGLSQGDVTVGAFLADLGRQLVAWNYPIIFSRALSVQRAGSGDLDTEIERMLGVDPRRISSQLAPRFGLSQELQQALSQMASRSTLASSGIGVEYSDIFRYARAYSEHLDPRNFSHGEEVFQQIAEKLQERIPSLPSSQEIEGRIAEVFGHYRDFVPARQRLGIAGWQHMVVPSDVGIMSSDQMAVRIPDCIADVITELVRTVEGAGQTVQALTRLVEEVIPRAGFSSGCVYLLSRAQQVLVPQIMIGEARDIAHDTIPLYAGNEVAQAVFSSMPVKHTAHNESSGQTAVRFVCGFQSPQVDGVLMLRGVSPELTQQQEYDQFNCFRSIHALLEMILRKDHEQQKSSP